MSATETRPAIENIVKSFSTATPDRVDAEYERLAGLLWDGETPTELALPAIPALVDELGQVRADRQAPLIVLLGLLVETEDPAAGGEIAAAVRRDLDQYLAMLRGSDVREPLALALLYLLSHFPGDRDQILGVAGAMAFGSDDATRLDRALANLDPDRPDLGRVWPAPSVWALDRGEQEFDRTQIAGLSREQIQTNWDNDTQTVLGYAGAKAYWAARRSVVPVTSDALPAQGASSPPQAAAGAAPLDDGLLARHLSVLRCPGCRGHLESRSSDIRCPACALVYPIANGILNLSAGVSDVSAQAKDEATADLLGKLAEMPSMGLYYEAVLRPAFLRIAGTNWGGLVKPSDEDDYIAAHVRPVDGPVLDLAAGAGRWTATVAKTVGADRLIVLDAGLPMLNVLRSRLPEVPALLGNALDLPFDDATLGAVNCWNALQAFPEDAARAIAEVGRCLRPGGTFTLMTFRFATDPILRYFQGAHHFPSRPEGMLLFELDQVRTWLADAGMHVRAESTPGSFIFITAERRG
jgi:SAM-dependent methyltransferase